MILSAASTAVMSFSHSVVVSLYSRDEFQQQQKFIRYDLEADSSDQFQSNTVCRAKIKVIIEVAKSDRILQKALAKSYGSRL